MRFKAVMADVYVYIVHASHKMEMLTVVLFIYGMGGE